MAAADNVRSAPRTYGNWRQPASAGIAGLGSLGTAIMMGGLLATIFSMMAGGLLGAVICLLVVGVVLLLLMTKDKHNLSALQRLSTRIGWQRAKMAKHNIYRSGPLGRTAWGKFQIPGLAAASQLSEFKDSYGRPFALLFYPSTRHFTVVINAAMLYLTSWISSYTPVHFTIDSFFWTAVLAAIIITIISLVADRLPGARHR